MKRNEVITTATNHDCKSHPKQAFWAKRVGLDEKIYLHAEVCCPGQGERRRG